MYNTEIKMFEQKLRSEQTYIPNIEELYILLTGMHQNDIKNSGYTIEKSQEVIVKDISYFQKIRLEKDSMELILKGRIDHRFNGGSEPVETVIEKNDFSESDLEKLFHIKNTAMEAMCNQTQ